MKLPTIGFVLVLVTCTILTTVSATELKTYIVHVSSPEGEPHEIEEWYNSFLSKVASRSNEKPEMVFTYRHAITGFAAKMTADQAKEMESLAGVLSVRHEGLHQLHTTRSPYFLGLRQDSGLWKDTNYGKGIIIGVLDSGITPGHPSFDDDGVPAPPSTWKGKREVAGCNNKLIAIRSFVDGKSTIDEEGHGTHTSSTAAGNLVDNANVFGWGNGTASGMAPLAHLAMYRVCDDYGCSDSAILAAIDAAIEDGVNVLSISLGRNDRPVPFYNDSIAVATFSAIQKGIFVSCSAGNSGPRPASVGNIAPWMLTVGESTIDRRFRTSVLFNEMVVGLKSDPEVALSSSRGPNLISPGILKPDIIGPGFQILAAWPVAVDNQTATKATFNILSGTSMACPHLSGIAALLKSAHPEWSPAAIKSALMTTASQVNRNGDPIVDAKGLPTDVFAIGSGHVNPPKAHDPGLVFDIQPDDYIPYLCGLGYTPTQIETIVKKKVSCSINIQEAQLNYASFAVSLKRGESKRYTRTVTNVGMPISSYTIRDMSVPKGVHIEVVVHNDTKLSFTEMYQKKTYEVTFSRDANDEANSLYGQGHMTWVCGKYAVRTPFSFKFE